jgi:hypothetical protein
MDICYLYFLMVWYIFPHFGMLNTRKIWQPWSACANISGPDLLCAGQHAASVRVARHAGHGHVTHTDHLGSIFVGRERNKKVFFFSRRNK